MHPSTRRKSIEFDMCLTLYLNNIIGLYGALDLIAQSSCKSHQHVPLISKAMNLYNTVHEYSLSLTFVLGSNVIIISATGNHW